MTTDKLEGKSKEIMGAGKEGAGEATDEEKMRDEAMDDKAEGMVKEKAAEIKEQTTRRRVRHNRG
jgi:uncharacterized protein YjbJ (UPF0337 family)